MNEYLRGKDEQASAHHRPGFRFHPSLPTHETGGLLCCEGSDELKPCWRGHVRNRPVTDLWLWISPAENDESIFSSAPPHLHTLKPAQTPGCLSLQTGSARGQLKPQASSASSYLHSFRAFNKNLGSGLSSSIPRTPGSTAGASGSDQNIWVLLGTPRLRLSQHSQPLCWNFFEVCRSRLMSTTVQIPAMLLDFQNHF